jgi:putative addiction module killer protein
MCTIVDTGGSAAYLTWMIGVRETTVFSDWLAKLRDVKAVSTIDIRIRRLSVGNPGDVKSVGGSVKELRIDYGPGYRVYFVERGKVAVVLLCGGDKRSQAADIALAQKLSKEL